MPAATTYELRATRYQLSITSHQLILPPVIVSVEFRIVTTQPSFAHSGQLRTPRATQQKGKACGQESHETCSRTCRGTDEAPEQMGRKRERALCHACLHLQQACQRLAYGWYTGRSFHRANTWSAEVAQLVEHVTENHGVGSSILPLGTRFPEEILGRLSLGGSLVATVVPEIVPVIEWTRSSFSAASRSRPASTWHTSGKWIPFCGQPEAASASDELDVESCIADHQPQ